MLEGHTPAHGAFAAVGTLAVVLGGVLLFRVEDSPYGTTSFWLVLAIAGSLGLIAIVRRDAHLAGAAAAPRGAGVALVGELATVLTGLHPSGQVLVQGERWQARLSEGGAEPGERVRVTGQRGLELEVERRAGCAAGA